MDTSITHIRPRFEFKIPYTKEDTFLRIRKLMAGSSETVIGKIVDNHVVIDIPEKHFHFWSPQLSFRVEEDVDENHNSVVKGLIGPRPNVWTMFTFIYFGIGTIGFFIFMYGASKWMLGEYSHLVWALPIAIIIMLTAFIAGKQGEKIGAKQVDILKQFVREALDLDGSKEPMRPS